MMKHFKLYLFVVLTVVSSLAFASYQNSFDKGKDAFQRGQFEVAVQYWDEALKLTSPDNPKRYIDTSVRLAAAYQKLGRLKEAHKLLETVLPLAENGNDPVSHAKVLMQLSDVYLAMRNFKEAHMDCGMRKISQDILPFLEGETFTSQNLIGEALYYLKKAKEVLIENDLKKTDKPLLWANLLNKKGNILLQEAHVLARKGENIDAEDKYNDEVFPIYKQSINLIKSSLTQAELNLQASQIRLKVAMNIIQGIVDYNGGNFEILQEELGITIETVLQWIEELPDSHDKAFILIGFSQLIMKKQSFLTEDKPSISPQQKLFAYNILMKALKVADIQKDYRSMMYAWFELAKLYAGNQRYQEATLLVKKAISHALNPDMLYRLEWHLGRYLKKLEVHDSGTSKEHQKAIEVAYENATKYLKQTRREYGSLPESFYEEKEEEKIYFGWLDVLLKRASIATGGNEKQKQLQKIIEVVEQLNAAEVRNYFQDECITEQLQDRIQHLDTVLPDKVAAFYPLLFEDRIELLLSSNKEIQQITVYPHVSMKDLEKRIYDFKTRLKERNWGEIEQKIAKELYTWLIKPLNNFLTPEHLDTLVIVPYGEMNNVSFAALVDEQDGKFLIEKLFTLVFTPGIKFIDFSDSMPRDNIRALLTGSDFEGVAGTTQLPNVPEELKKIRKLFMSKGFRSTVLEKDKFTFNNLKQELKKEAYSVVHCATHGKVTNDPDVLFSLSLHGEEKVEKIRLKELRTFFVKLDRDFKGQPIKLLTLSACETAKRRGHLVLGFAGLLLKAKIPSSMGTLWQVEEKSSGKLMERFYFELLEGNSKAQALQKAQQYLLELGRQKEKTNEPYDKPYFWAPYLLIGNWR
ncbi:CHAT domain-containing protein [Candidatus Parabeggiatoa sp. HSG14]|uniref:CHAT domain-containing protein n=1 Tax=Candidatus Parabeggiatoa sp. HSG14 TaxID=3055593 RepID=UPI0025A8BE44|nr:CHAT domain-containing protein [Thiotrichales bacterium HSG14]